MALDVKTMAAEISQTRKVLLAIAIGAGERVANDSVNIIAIIKLKKTSKLNHVSGK